MMELLLLPDWRQLFSFSVPPIEIVVRGSVMYAFLFALFRIVIRRDVGSVGIADILIIVIIADAAQNGMAGSADSVADGMLLVATLIGWNVVLDWLTYRFPTIRRLAQPEPLKLVQGGRILWRNLRREYISEDELWSNLRLAGVSALEQVEVAYMEPDGRISVVKRK